MALADIPEEIVVRTIEWYESIEDPEIQDNTFVALEYLLTVRTTRFNTLLLGLISVDV